MKKVTIIYLLILFAALIGAVLLVNISSSPAEGTSIAFDVFPEDSVIMMYVEDTRSFLRDLQTKLDNSLNSPVNIYSFYVHMNGLKGGEKITSESDLENILGLCLESPSGNCQIDNTATSEISFFSVNNELAFEQFLGSFYTIRKEEDEGNEYLILKPNESGGKNSYLYKKNSTVFITGNQYYMKKLMRYEGKTFKSNENFFDLKKKNPDRTAYLYLNTGKMARLVANTIGFVIPSITQQLENPELKLPEGITKDEAKAAVSELAQSIVKFLKSQDFIILSVLPTSDGYSVDFDVNIKLSEETVKVFNETNSAEDLTGLVPKGPLVILEDNTTENQVAWFNNTMSLLTINTRDKEPTNLDKKDRRVVFGMYPGKSLETMFKQITISHEEDDNVPLTPGAELEKLNAKMKDMENILPVKLKFFAVSSRTYENADINRFKLKINLNDQSILKIFMGGAGNNSRVKVMTTEYPFEMTYLKDFSVFAGGDTSNDWMNDVLDNINNPDAPKAANTEAFRTVRKNALENATVNLYLNLSTYMASVLSNVENHHPRGEGRVDSLAATFPENWSLLSIKLNENGMKLRIHIDMNDVGQMLRLSQAVDYLDSGTK